MDKINPRLLQGFRDFLPEKKRQRDWMINQVKSVYESFGFSPLETPVLEFSDILLGKYGEEAKRLMYRFKDQGERDVSMRYDLTVPFARVIAQYPELVKPFKRYQVAPVWRADSPQAGRYREFYQFDVDVAGSSSTLADSEMVNLISTSMQSLGIAKFNIRINNRKVLNGLIEWAKIDKDDSTKVFQLIDKIEKISAEDFEKSLLDILSASQTEKILEFVKTKGINSQIIAKLKEIFVDNSIGLEGTEELEETVNYLQAAEVDMDIIKIDLSIARGLDYYTGIVYETILLDAPEFGSVFSGGRYDELIGYFIGTNVPAVGVSLGVDRLFAAMEKLELLPKVTDGTQVLVTVFEENPTDSVKIAQILRENNIKTEIYLGGKSALGPQLTYANKLAVPVCVITFADQVAKDIYTVKKMTEKFGENEQIETNFDGLIDTVKKMLE